MNNLLSQKWCLCLNVQNRIKLCRAKNHKFGDDTTVYIYDAYVLICVLSNTNFSVPYLSQENYFHLKF